MASLLKIADRVNAKKEAAAARMASEVKQREDCAEQALTAAQEKLSAIETDLDQAEDAAKKNLLSASEVMELAEELKAAAKNGRMEAIDAKLQKLHPAATVEVCLKALGEYKTQYGFHMPAIKIGMVLYGVHNKVTISKGDSVIAQGEFSNGVVEATKVLRGVEFIQRKKCCKIDSIKPEYLSSLGDIFQEHPRDGYSRDAFLPYEQYRVDGRAELAILSSGDKPMYYGYFFSLAKDVDRVLEGANAMYGEYEFVRSTTAYALKEFIDVFMSKMVFLPNIVISHEGGQFCDTLGELRNVLQEGKGYGSRGVIASYAFDQINELGKDDDTRLLEAFTGIPVAKVVECVQAKKACYKAQAEFDAAKALSEKATQAAMAVAGGGVGKDGQGVVEAKVVG